MSNSLSLFIDNRELSSTATKLFESYLSESDNEDYFYNLFGVSYRFMFGDIKYDRFVFELLERYYRNDFFVRHRFFSNVLSTKNATSFFELPVNESRADMVSINGKSVAYEIKTRYDSLNRLTKQLDDYSKAFEYVYVICDRDILEDVLNTIPSHCGIYTYNDRNRISFKLYKRAIKSDLLDNKTMLSMMLKSERIRFFKNPDIESILSDYDSETIDLSFKKALKKRFIPKMDEINKRCELFI